MNLEGFDILLSFRQSSWVFFWNFIRTFCSFVFVGSTCLILLRVRVSQLPHLGLSQVLKTGSCPGKISMCLLNLFGPLSQIPDYLIFYLMHVSNWHNSTQRNLKLQCQFWENSTRACWSWLPLTALLSSHFFPPAFLGKYCFVIVRYPRDI